MHINNTNIKTLFITQEQKQTQGRDDITLADI